MAFPATTDSISTLNIVIDTAHVPVTEGDVMRWLSKTLAMYTTIVVNV